MATTTRSRPVRVTKTDPCPVCGHDTWCMTGDKYNICMRVSSPRTKILTSGETAYLHEIGGTSSGYIQPKPERPSEPEHFLDVQKHIEFLEDINHGRSLTDLALNLGVDEGALHLIGCRHSGRFNVYSFPMKDGSEQIVGFRLRHIDGSKWAVKGSHQGLFIPSISPTVPDEILIVEGPTDCAAALSIGYFAVGRPSCSGGVAQLKEYLRRHQIRSVVVVADLDDPGLKGAQSLTAQLPVLSAIMVCPSKDLRAAVKNGMDNQLMKSMIRQLIWR